MKCLVLNYTIVMYDKSRFEVKIVQEVSKLAIHVWKADADVSLVTIGNQSYYVYRYEGSFNGIDDAAVLISYPKDAFHAPGALRAFISTDASLGTQEILDRYTERWPSSVSLRTNWHLTDTTFVPRKEFRGTGC